MSVHCGWAYTKRELIVKSMECKSTKSKNPKPVVPAKQFSSQVQNSEPDKKLQIYFGGPIFDERCNVIYLLAGRKIF